MKKSIEIEMTSVRKMQHIMRSKNNNRIRKSLAFYYNIARQYDYKYLEAEVQRIISMDILQFEKEFAS